MRFENLSFLPPLSNAQITAHVERMLSDDEMPMIEFMETPNAEEVYWKMWQLPGETELTPRHIMAQIDACHRRNPYAFVRLSSYNKTQRTCSMSFIAKTPLDAA